MNRLLFCLLGFFLALSAQAQNEVIFNNTANYLGRFNSLTNESGDQINLNDNGRQVNYFSFDYFGSFSTNSTSADDEKKARVRFYLNDGSPEANPAPAPATLLYDSGAFGIIPGYQTVEISNISVFIPGSTFTWTVQFQGINADEKAGVLFYDPPQLGTSADYLWEKGAEGWSAVTIPGVTNNLSAKVVAVAELRVRSLQFREGSVLISFRATPGKLYSIEFKDSVQGGSWQSLAGGSFRATSEEETVLDSNDDEKSFRVYRLAESDLSIARSASGVSVISSAVPGKRYALEVSIDQQNWTRLQTLTATGFTVAFNAATESPNAVFRVVPL